jgi:hypothetical protein
MEPKVKEVLYEYPLGTDIKEAAEDAYHKCIKNGCNVKFDFNGLKVTLERRK